MTLNEKKVLLRKGLADKNAIFVVNFFSHNVSWLHDEITARIAAYGMLATYNGMSIPV